MRPFHVQRLLLLPVPGHAGPRRVDARQPGGAARLVELDEARRVGQAVLAVELRQVAGGEVGRRAVDQGGVVVGVDDRDRLAGPVARDPAEGDGVEAIGRGDLLRAEAPGRSPRTRTGAAPRSPAAVAEEPAATSIIGRTAGGTGRPAPAARAGTSRISRASGGASGASSAVAARRIGAGGSSMRPSKSWGGVSWGSGGASAPPRRAGPMVRRAGIAEVGKGPATPARSAIAEAAASGRARLADHKLTSAGPAPGPDHHRSRREGRPLEINRLGPSSEV